MTDDPIEAGEARTDPQPGDLQVGRFLVQPRLLRIIAADGVEHGLEPKTMHVLTCLAASPRQAVTRRELFDAVWSDTVVSEHALNRCVHKLRKVFGDDSSKPAYIETIPSIGYRLVAPVAPVRVPTTEPSRTLTRRWGWSIGVALLVAVTGLAAWTLRGTQATSDQTADTTVRVAVMPSASSAEGLAEGVLRRLAAIDEPTMEVVGPTTTAAYRRHPSGLRGLIAEMDVDLVVNFRPTEGEDGDRILLEVIRASDGAHVWVRYLHELPPGRDAAAVVAQAVADVGGGMTPVP